LFRRCGVVREIPLTRGQVALVDDGDYERVSKFKWYALWDPSRRTYRALRNKQENESENGKRGLIYLHRFIMKVPKGKDIDHRDRDPLNNQKNNLRICTRAQNNMNKLKREGYSSEYKGVSWNKQKLKWEASIGKDYKKHHLGLFTDETDAAIAYNKAALEMFGEYAVLNDVPDAADHDPHYVNPSSYLLLEL